MAAGADFDYQQSPWIEIPAGCRKYALHHREAVPAAGERGAWLVPVLARQPLHAARRHVRRVADDKVVSFSAQRGK